MSASQFNFFSTFLNLTFLISCRLNELVSSGDGLAILEQGLAFGGGDLVNFGINSNTSARGFIKCCYKKRDIVRPPADTDSSHSPTKTFLKRGQGAPAANS